MSSVVHYKFKSQREASRVVFDGTAISVWDLKREIIIRNKMGKGIDFDIGLYNAQTEEEYRDDNFSIPRSSTVIVRRLPPSRPGRGTAQSYVADLYGGADAGESSRFGPSASGVAQQRDRAAGPSYRGPMSVRFDDRAKESATPGPPPVLPPSIAQQSGENGGGDEAAGIAAMFQATTDQWDATQQQMATATYRPRGGGPPRGGGRGGSFQPRGDRGGGDHHPHSDRPPPTGYICYRCGKKGHWIQECPTNKDPDWDDKPRFKRTTGIPKSMLKTVENPTDEQRQSGVMVTADGTYVVAQVDSATWEKERATGVKVLSKSDVYQSVPSDSTLACPLCSKLLRNPVQTPCCSTKFCEECIQTHLLEHDFSCAECDKRIADLGNLKRDDETRRKVETYVEEAVKKSEEEIREREQQQQQREEGDKKEEDAGDEAKGKEQEGGATEEAAVAEATPAAQEPAIPVVAFNPQLVQQLVMTLSNPQLPPPMRAMLQTQLQAQQMAFMRMQQSGPPPQQPGVGMGMQPMMMGGGPNPMMGMMMGGGGGGGAMGATGGTMNGGMNGGMNNAMGGYGRPPPPPQRMGNGVGAGMMGRGGFRPPVAAHGMKRGRDASSLEGGPSFDPSKMARMQ